MRFGFKFITHYCLVIVTWITLGNFGTLKVTSVFPLSSVMYDIVVALAISIWYSFWQVWWCFFTFKVFYFESTFFCLVALPKETISHCVTLDMDSNKQNYFIIYSFYWKMYFAERKIKSAYLLIRKQFLTNFTGLNIFISNFQLYSCENRHHIRLYIFMCISSL